MEYTKLFKKKQPAQNESEHKMQHELRLAVLSVIEQAAKWVGRGHLGSRNMVWVKLGRTHEQDGDMLREFV